MLSHFFIGLTIFLGEIFIVIAEMLSARHFDSGRAISTLTAPLILGIVGVIILVCGYAYGYASFKNIWIITALTVAGIFIVEPLCALVLFKETPTLGASIALILGVIGLFTTLFIS